MTKNSGRWEAFISDAVENATYGTVLVQSVDLDGELTIDCLTHEDIEKWNLVPAMERFAELLSELIGEVVQIKLFHSAVSIGADYVAHISRHPADAPKPNRGSSPLGPPDG